MNAVFKALRVLLFSILASGCAASGDQFSIKVTNYGRASIQDWRLQEDKFFREASVLPVGRAGTRSFFPDNDLRVPEQLIADWSTPDGRRHHAVIDLGIPGSDHVAEKYDVPRLDQRWHILVAYMDDVVKSGWVVYDARYKKKPDYFGRHVLFGGDEEVLIRDHMLRPELLDRVPKYSPARNDNGGIGKR